MDRKRGSWFIRDGAAFIRLGLPESERERAELRLRDYLAEKYEPERGPDPTIADVLLVYARDHVPHIATARDTGLILSRLAAWWGDRRASHVTAANCRAFAAERTPAAARKDLATLRAAVGHWRRNYGPLQCSVVLPPRRPPRDRWLTRSEAARLLRAARVYPHVARFVLLGLYTGSRPGVSLGLTWAQVDLDRGVLYRRPRGAQEQANKRTPPVRLGRRILAHLRRWRRRDPHSVYVCHYNGARIKTLTTSWPATIERAGLEGDVTPHCLRRTRATWLMQAGVDVWESAGHLGMSVATLTRTYAKHHPDWQRRAAEV